MKNIKFIAGKTTTGYDAYTENRGLIVAITTGTDLTELRGNASEAYNLYLEAKGKPENLCLIFTFSWLLLPPLHAKSFGLSVFQFSCNI
jgi:hypothetical protein